PNPRKIETGLHAFLVGVLLLVHGVIMLGALWGCYLLLRSRKYFESIAVLSLIIYFVVITAGLEAFSRYRVPIMPYFALLAGYAAASEGARRASQARNRTTSPRP
ncbi:MAG: hypothetical protein ACRDFW_04910, partial [bacterium]